MMGPSKWGERPECPEEERQGTRAYKPPALGVPASTHARPVGYLTRFDEPGQVCNGGYHEIPVPKSEIFGSLGW